MPNRLIESNSPYLLQHAENPVDWYPWGEEALQRARQEDKPIFLSIGYAACHWCHVMAHESFEDDETARIMNQYFINIKVDREERPDLDSIYMDAVVAMTGSGGWPMSVFLTPEGKPFYGGTYFPPSVRFNLPSFRDVLLRVARAWEDEKGKIRQAANQITEQVLSVPMRLAAGRDISPALLDQAAVRLAQTYDWKHGGWGSAPKFPQPMAIDFLLRRASRGDNFAFEIATHALKSMAKGGMYDLIGGGFSRYSTDNNWLVPHFEKMLYDNAQLARVYLHAYLLTQEKRFLQICEETVRFVMREMTHPSGGFYSSLDADTNGEEGSYYLWSYDELNQALRDPFDKRLLLTAYGVSEHGNFDGKNLLQLVDDEDKIAAAIGLSLDVFQDRLEKIHASLLRLREERSRPGLDDKVLVSWNCLMVVVLCDVYRYIGGEDSLLLAMRNLKFILDHMLIGDQLKRSWRNGRVSQNAFLEDYASLILALISMYQVDPDPAWYLAAEQLVNSMIDRFYDPDGGFFDTSGIEDPLIVRPKEIQDNALPSGNSLAVTALLQFSALSGRTEVRRMAEEVLVSVSELVIRYPLSFANWLCAMDAAVNPGCEIAVLGDRNNPLTQELVKTVWSMYRPYAVLAVSDFPPPPGSPLLLLNRSLVNELPTAYVCRSFVCKQPVNSPDELIRQLDDILSDDHTRISITGQ